MPQRKEDIYWGSWDLVPIRPQRIECSFSETLEVSSNPGERSDGVFGVLECRGLSELHSADAGLGVLSGRATYRCKTQAKFFYPFGVGGCRKVKLRTALYFI